MGKVLLVALLGLTLACTMLLTQGHYMENNDLGEQQADQSQSDQSQSEQSQENNYQDNNLASNNDKRGCIRRGGACDHRPNECCFSSSCRCNLWGSNCRCQRMGLFQKWG